MNASKMYEMNLNQIARAIGAVGHKRCVLVEGHMGNGKTSLLTMLSKMFPDHIPCYFNCVTKDLGDLSIPSLNTTEGYVTYLPNEEFGIHHGKPLIIMWDEWSKANQSVKNGTLVTMLERTVGTKKLPEGSIQFATANLGAEGVGDTIPPHARNRMIMLRARKSTSEELIEYGINHEWEPSVLGFIREFPQILQGFEDVKNPNDNPYINHPKAQRTAFVTPRSLEACSDILKQRHMFDDHSLTALLMGTIGDRGAMDLVAFVKLADQLPSWESIKQDPTNAKVPDSASAVCMVVYRALGNMTRETITPFMQYLPRLSKEAQGMFANGVRANTYAHRSLVMSNKLFTAWAMQNNYMFSADK